MTPLVSIVIPSRDRPAYLEVALASVAPQAARAGAEVIVVDDGELARNAELAERFGARYVALGRPRGLNAARNAGVAAAAGDVTYRRDRGEPKLSVKEAAKAKAAGLPAGDCVDCHQCVHACPTGVDIRNGSQLGCIQCGLCIDACDAVMKKIGRPQGWIAYDTDENIRRRARGEAPVYRLVRPRTILYAAAIAVVGSVMLYALAFRTHTSLSVLHVRAPMYTLIKDGVRNVYTLRFRQQDGRSLGTLSL